MAIDPSTLFNSASEPSGTDFLNQYSAFMGGLVNTAVLSLVSIAGSNTITASAEPFSVPSTGYVSGMKFAFTAVANNTGPATLNIDGRGAEALISADGSDLSADEIVSGTRYLVERRGTGFRLLSATSAAAGGGSSRTVYDTTTVWANNLAANAIVQVELWGAGGGGSTAGGGGGGSYAVKTYIAGDLPTTVTITVPAGGAGGGTPVDGGDCTFGSLLTGFGGERATAGGGGGGGGEIGRGLDISGGAVGGGDGGSLADPGSHALTIHGGGGGGGSGGGGSAVYGGGGGSGAGGTGGTSKYGGNGGSGVQAGQRPGGGGGESSNGGGGRAIITIFGN